MCRPILCKTCHKTTWAGCGMHVAAVRALVPADQWCSGHQQEGHRFSRLRRKPKSS